MLPDLSYSYVYTLHAGDGAAAEPGGVRLAAYLNAVFAEPQVLPERQPDDPPACRPRLSALFALGLRGAGHAAAAPVAAAPIEVQILAINDFHGNIETPAGPGRRSRRRTAGC